MVFQCVSLSLASVTSHSNGDHLASSFKNYERALAA